MRLNGTSAYTTVQLGEGDKVPNTVQVLRVGKFNHPQYGFFEITSQVLSEMKENFDKKIRGIDISFDYYHDSNEDASAWVKSLELSSDKQELWATVDWTPKAQKKLSDRELRYFSPDFTFLWEDPESGKSFSNVLFGGGLTNRPFVKEMKAIVADELKTGVKTMTELEKAQAKIKELEAAQLKLSEDNAGLEKKLAAMPDPEDASEVEMLKKQIADLQAALAKAQGDAEVALAEKKKADEAKMLAEKETAFNLLLTEGKACAAQKDAYIKNDMTEFIKLAQPLNMKAQGTSTTPENTTEAAQAEKIMKLAEEKRKANKALTLSESVSLAKKELETKQ